MHRNGQQLAADAQNAINENTGELVKALKGVRVRGMVLVLAASGSASGASLATQCESIRARSFCIVGMASSVDTLLALQDCKVNMVTMTRIL